MGDPFNVCSLFSGGAGLDLGIHRAVRGSRTVVYVEREAFACEVLATRMEEGSLAPAPVWTDVTTFDGRPWRGVVDCVAGGSPCQDLSVAGNRAGLDGARSGLFFQFVRIVEEIRPSFVFWENVGGAASALPRVFDAFAALGYAGAAVKLRASDVGASHQRARIFLLGRLADSERAAVRVESGRGSGSRRNGSAQPSDTRLDVANSHSHGREGERGGGVLHEIGTTQRNNLDRQGGSAGMADSGGSRFALGLGLGGALREASGGVERQDAARVDRPRWPPGPQGDWSGVPSHFFPAQPRFRRMADGLARGVVQSVQRDLDTVWADRLRMLGNGVVPDQAAEAWLFLKERLK